MKRRGLCAALIVAVAMGVIIAIGSLKTIAESTLGTDLAEEEVVRGNAVSIMLHCPDEMLTRTYYQRLEVGGKATHPLEENYWGGFFGGLTDRYGNHWLFYCGLGVG